MAYMKYETLMLVIIGSYTLYGKQDFIGEFGKSVTKQTQFNH